MYKISAEAERVTVVLPSLNPSEKFDAVVDGLIEAGFKSIVIVDDGSRQENKTHFQRASAYPGVKVLTHEVNRGKSAALKTAFAWIMENCPDCTGAVTIDGDGQHDPKYIPEMVDKMEQSGTDLVIASRFINEKRKLTMRTFGNSILDAAIRITTGKKITDSTSGMRMYGKRLLEIMAFDLNSTPEPDTVAYLLLCGAKVEECQVTMRERTAGESYLNPWRSMMYMGHMCFSICLIQRLRKRRKL